jgi:hypothetical protein
MNYQDRITTDAADFAKKTASYENYGKLRLMKIEFTLAAVLALGDKIFGIKLPKNALISDASIKLPSLGATGIVSLGIVKDGTEFKDSLIKVADAGGQAVLERADKDSSDIGYVTGDNDYLMIECNEASILAVGKIEGFVTISVE